jgi:hypothetical protein
VEENDLQRSRNMMLIIKISCNGGLKRLRHRLRSQRCKCIPEGETPQDMCMKGSIDLSSYLTSKVLGLGTSNVAVCKVWLDSLIHTSIGPTSPRANGAVTMVKTLGHCVRV